MCLNMKRDFTNVHNIKITPLKAFLLYSLMENGFHSGLSCILCGMN